MENWEDGEVGGAQPDLAGVLPAATPGPEAAPGWPRTTTPHAMPHYASPQDATKAMPISHADARRRLSRVSHLACALLFWVEKNWNLNREKKTPELLKNSKLASVWAFLVINYHRLYRFTFISLVKRLLSLHDEIIFRESSHWTNAVFSGVFFNLGEW